MNNGADERYGGLELGVKKRANLQGLTYPRVSSPPFAQHSRRENRLRRRVNHPTLGPGASLPVACPRARARPSPSAWKSWRDVPLETRRLSRHL